MPDQLDAEAAKLRETILTTRAKVVSLIGLMAPDGSLRGPFEPLLGTPAIGQVVQRLGLVVRSGSELGNAICEAVILTIVREWDCGFEWNAHRTVALATGVLREEDIDRIADGRRLADDQLALACEFALQQTSSREPDAATKAAATELFGERGVVELTVLVSYYELVCRLTAIGGTGA
jgi:4-carboxymuconolactone decarboxylase